MMQKKHQNPKRNQIKPKKAKQNNKTKLNQTNEKQKSPLQKSNRKTPQTNHKHPSLKQVGRIGGQDASVQK